LFRAVYNATTDAIIHVTTSHTGFASNTLYNDDKAHDANQSHAVNPENHAVSHGNNTDSVPKTVTNHANHHNTVIIQADKLGNVFTKSDNNHKRNDNH
jgi:hypothetical protein